MLHDSLLLKIPIDIIYNNKNWIKQNDVSDNLRCRFIKNFNKMMFQMVQDVVLLKILTK